MISGRQARIFFGLKIGFLFPLPAENWIASPLFFAPVVSAASLRLSTRIYMNSYHAGIASMACESQYTIYLNDVIPSFVVYKCGEEENPL
jgi:hypothetical protein